VVGRCTNFASVHYFLPIDTLTVRPICPRF